MTPPAGPRSPAERLLRRSRNGTTCSTSGTPQRLSRGARGGRQTPDRGVTEDRAPRPIGVQGPQIPTPRQVGSRGLPGPRRGARDRGGSSSERPGRRSPEAQDRPSMGRGGTLPQRGVGAGGDVPGGMAVTRHMANHRGASPVRATSECADIDDVRVCELADKISEAPPRTEGASPTDRPAVVVVLTAHLSAVDTSADVASSVVGNHRTARTSVWGSRCRVGRPGGRTPRHASYGSTTPQGNIAHVCRAT